MFDGLYSYEIVLLCTGLILFVALLWAFIVQVRTKSLGASLVMFFVIDIAMIGFPSIKEIQYKDGVVTLDKTTTELQDEPNDTALRTALENRLEDILPRASSGFTNANSLVKVAAAQYALGRESGAKETLRSALAENPSAPEALDLKQKIETVDTIRRLTSLTKAGLGDDNTSANLRAAVQQASSMNLANPKAMKTVADAQTVLAVRNAADMNRVTNPPDIDHRVAGPADAASAGESSDTRKAQPKKPNLLQRLFGKKLPNNNTGTGKINKGTPVAPSPPGPSGPSSVNPHQSGGPGVPPSDIR